MTTPDLDILAKGPLYVFLVVAHAKSSITATDDRRFAELMKEAAGPNARVCVYTSTLRHLLHHWERLHDEVSGFPDSEAIVRAVRAGLSALPPDESARFRAQLARIAVASARDEAGQPVPAAVEMCQSVGLSLGMPPYGAYSKRFTDDFEIVDYWPGCDPALQDFTEAELRKLAAVFGGLFATLAACHGAPMPEHEDAMRRWLMNGYAPGREGCRVHALLRYVDQLFMLVQVEVQYAESLQPVFKQGHALVKERLNQEEQEVFMRLFHDLGVALMMPGSPPAASEMLGKITAIMLGRPDPEPGDGLTPDDWDVLSLGLLSAFFLMAAADGTLGAKEKEAFGSVVKAATQAAHLGVAAQAAARIPGEIQRLWPLAASRKVPPGHFVAEAMQLLRNRLGSEELHAYGHLVMTIAEETAKAEGGGILGLGAKISKEERAVLNELKRVVGLS